MDIDPYAESVHVLQLLTDPETQPRHYERGNHVATGGMGLVFQLHDHLVGRTTAMKIMHNELTSDKLKILQFIEEARITGGLEHPNIIPVHNIGLDSHGHPYFTMKYVEGDPLSTVLELISHGDQQFMEYYSPFTLLTIFRKVCDAVAYAHSRGVVHRDIKPENIMVGSYGEVLLMDWGIAKRLNQHEPPADSRPHPHPPPPAGGAFATTTMIGMIKGSPGYMSPEQAAGEMHRYDQRSDIFLLGATLYHITTLRIPYEGNSIEEIILKAECCDFLEPVKANPKAQIPADLNRIILKAMSMFPEDRYQTVEELIADLDRFLSGQVSFATKRFAAGQDIIVHGDSGHEAYVITEGIVEVYKRLGGKKTVFSRLHPGDVFGEMALITDEPRSASVAALTDTLCHVITPETISQQLDKLPPWFAKIVTNLTQRLRSTDNLIHPLLISDCTYEILCQARLLIHFYGRVDPSGAISMNLPELTYEIANNIKIPENRVRPVLASLCDIGLARVDASMMIAITSWNLFLDFVEFSKNAPRLTLTSTRVVSTVDVHRSYTDGISLIHRISHIPPNEQPPPLGAMRPVKDAIAKEAIDAFRLQFPDKLRQLQEIQQKAEVSQRSQPAKNRRTPTPASIPNVRMDEPPRASDHHS